MVHDGAGSAARAAAFQRHQAPSGWRHATRADPDPAQTGTQRHGASQSLGWAGAWRRVFADAARQIPAGAVLGTVRLDVRKY